MIELTREQVQALDAPNNPPSPSIPGPGRSTS